MENNNSINSQFNSFKGATALVGATLLYSTLSILIRSVNSLFPIYVQNWVRSLLLFFTLLVIFLFKTKFFPKIQKKDLGWIIMWLISGTIAFLTFYFAVNNTQIGTTLFTFYAGATVSGVICGTIFFKEHFRINKILALIVSLIGLLFIYQSNFDRNIYLFLAMALVSGIFTGIWNTIAKKFSDHYRTASLIFIDSGFNFVVCLVLAAISHQDIPQFSLSVPWVMIIILTLVQVSSEFLVIYGFRKLEAQIGSLLMPLEVFWAVILAMLVYNEKPSTLTMIGGGLIVLATIIPVIRLSTKKSLIAKAEA